MYSALTTTQRNATSQAALARRLAFVEGLRYGMALAGLDAPDPTQYQTVETFDGE